ERDAGAAQDVAGVAGVVGPPPVVQQVAGVLIVNRVAGVALADEQGVAGAVGDVGDTNALVRGPEHTVPRLRAVRVTHGASVRLVADERPLQGRLLGGVLVLAGHAGVGRADQGFEGKGDRGARTAGGTGDRVKGVRIPRAGDLVVPLVGVVLLHV